MSDYTETYSKVTGNPVEVSDFETEFDSIATAVATKANKTGAPDTTNNLAMLDSAGDLADSLVETDGAGNITANVTGNATGSAGSCTGNAATATTLSAATGNTAGNRVLIEAQTGGGTSYDFTTGIDSTYDIYEIELINIVNANSVGLYFHVSLDAGATWEDDGVVSTYKVGTGTQNYFGLSAAYTNTAALGGSSGKITIFNPSSATIQKHITSKSIASLTVGGVSETKTACFWQDTSAVNGFQIKAATGNIVTGTMNLYGIKK